MLAREALGDVVGSFAFVWDVWVRVMLGIVPIARSLRSPEPFSDYFKVYLIIVMTIMIENYAFCIIK